MRSPSEPSLAPWMTRVLSPWLVATFGGLCIGTALMRIDNPTITRLSPDLGTRAAMYDVSPANPSESNGAIADDGAPGEVPDTTSTLNGFTDKSPSADAQLFGGNNDAMPSAYQAADQTAGDSR